MTERDDKRLSKFLSYVLRHDPSAAGVELDAGGWVEVWALLDGAALRGRGFDRQQLDRVVAENEKKRFTFSDDRIRIRAAQGHSVEVDLGLTPATPPDTLYHGTARDTVPVIQAEGLRPGSRRHVHLSRDVPTARTVGQRHGKPVVFHVAAARACEDGQVFYQADNGVWLTGPLAPTYLSLPVG
ncbi:MAG: RNA 2'-phosphotransferase [Paracoccaceae bacterium]